MFLVQHSPDGAELLEPDGALLQHSGLKAVCATRRAGLRVDRLHREGSATSGTAIESELPNGQVLVFDGRLDYRADLRSALGLGDRQVRNADLVGAAWLRWGEGCTHRLYGDYAIVVIDPASGRLWAATDHRGVGSLYFTASDGRVVLSSVLPAVLACRGVDRTLDELALSALPLAITCQGRTAFRGVRLLESGHSLSCGDGEAPRIQRWWRPDLAPADTERDHCWHASRLHDLMREAVNERLPASSDAASLLSGGLDSSTVTAMAAVMAERDGCSLHAITVSPNPELPRFARRGWVEDDFVHAVQLVQRHPAIRHHRLYSAGRPAPDDWPDLHRVLATPLRNVANGQWMADAFRLAASRGCDALLVGQTGNHTISRGHRPAALASLFRYRHWGEFGSELFERPAALPRALAGLIRFRFGGNRVRTRRHRDAFLPAATSIGLTPTGSLQAACEKVLSGVDFDDPMGYWRIAMLNGAFIVDSRLVAGIACRDPTSDRRLVEAIMRMPAHAFQHRGRSRALARSLGEGLVPDCIRLREARGEQCPDEPGLFMAHPMAYGQAMARLRESPLSRLYGRQQLEHAYRQLRGGSGDRVAARILHSALEVAAFIETAAAQWGSPEPDFHELGRDDPAPG